MFQGPGCLMDCTSAQPIIPSQRLITAVPPPTAQPPTAHPTPLQHSCTSPAPLLLLLLDLQVLDYVHELDDDVEDGPPLLGVCLQAAV